MTNRENTLAILNYHKYSKMPVVSFGYWVETLDKWADEGYITRQMAQGYRNHGDNSDADKQVMQKLGFDFNWNSCIGSNVLLNPSFDVEVLETKPDGSRIIRDNLGLICMEKPNTVSISSEISKERKAF